MRAIDRTIVAAFVVTLSACGNGGNAITAKPGELVEVARSDALWSGVTVSTKGRVFVCHPRWFGPHTDSVVEILPGGRRRPYPSREMNQWRPGAMTPPPESAWVCAQSVRCEGKWLFVLDAGNPAFGGVIESAAKLVQIDLAGDRPVRTWRLTTRDLDRTSYLNDVRVDVARRAAYMTDSELGALFVLDLESGVVKRRLADHPSTKADPTVTPTVEGRPLMRKGGDGALLPLRLHADGLALDAAGDTLYWQALTGRTLYRIRTAVLRDAAASDEAVAAAVERVGETVVADGIEMDASGRLFLTAIERDAIVERLPDGRIETVVSDPRLAWPSSLALGPNGTLYVTTSQIHRMPMVTGGPSMPRTPFLLFATGIPPRR